MRNTYNTLIFVAKCVVLGLALAFVVGTLAPKWRDRVRKAFSPHVVEQPASPPAAAATAPDPHGAVTTEHNVAPPAALAEEGQPGGTFVRSCAAYSA